nr:PEP/pyruvate-binding domain-containing protein [Kineosphaera limosa]
MLVHLRDSECRDVAAVGGKAVNLHALLAAGLPVPEGFVVSTRAYREATACLQEALEPLFERLRDPQLTAAELPDVAARIREFVSLIDLPTALRRALSSAYTHLGRAEPVAVRSSATAEDLRDASFAGQQDTYLNVIGGDAVAAAVHACWASLWTTRAVAYRRERGIDPADVALAVVVQRMVEAASAGVMFTADPVTGCRTHTVIDANAGLGESVVSGEVNPDRYVVETATGAVLEQRIGDRGVAVRARAGGGVLREATSGSTPLLTPAELGQLAALGHRAQELFGAPQDTEWAIDGGGTPWLTQARPVTTLYPLVHRAQPAPNAGQRRLFLCASLAQGLTRPITPLGRSAFKLITGGGARIVGFDVPDVRRGGPAYAEGGQRIFGDITAPMRNPVGRHIALFAMRYMETRSAIALGRLHDEPDFRPPSGRVAAVVGGARAALRIGRMFVASRLPIHAAISLVDPAQAVARTTQAIADLRALPQLPPSPTALMRLDAVEQLLATRAPVTMPGLAGYAIPGFAVLAAARALAVDLRPGDLETVLRGLPHNVTTQMDLELWALSGRLRAGEVEPSTPDLAGFLDRWGDRAVAEIDLGMPRWREEPDHLLGVLRNYARLGPAQAAQTAVDPAAQFEAAAVSAQQAVEDLLARVPNPARRAALGFALDRARRLIGLRESPKLGLITLLARAREQTLLIGAELAADGLLDAPQDVAFLDVIELRQAIEGADLRARVAAVRADYDAELRRRHIPRLLLSDGTELEALAGPAAETDKNTLTGTPASSGVVTATARVVTDPVGAHLEPGEILVAPSTDPGWTPLFLTAGGLVMEMGGSNSHGAVVAREYGIPAVVGVPHACTRLHTGDRLRVDGAAGTIRIEPADSVPENSVSENSAPKNSVPPVVPGQ